MLRVQPGVTVFASPMAISAVESFSRVDAVTSRDGIVTPTELLVYMTRRGRSIAEAEELFLYLDADSSGTIVPAEWSGSSSAIDDPSAPVCQHACAYIYMAHEYTPSCFPIQIVT